MLEVYGNSRQFDYTLRFLIPLAGTPFDFFERLSDYYRKQNLYGKNFSRLERFEILRKFARGELLKRKTDGMNMRNSYPSEEKKLDEYLVFDLYLRENCRNRPGWAKEYVNRKLLFRKFLHQFYDKQKTETERSMSNCMHGELFYTDIMQSGHTEPVFIVFDYRKRNPISGNAEFSILRITELQ